MVHFQLYAWLGAGGGFFRRFPEWSTSTYREQVGPLVSLALGTRLFWSLLGEHHALRVEVRDFSWLDSYATSTGTQTGIINMVTAQLGYTFLF